MPLSRFLESYVKALHEGNAALFAGAGLSRSGGFVDWSSLLRPVAKDLGLEIHQETDLPALAQYHVNQFGRGLINQILVDEFCRDAVETENHRILAALPIRFIWTTNYEDMLESVLRRMGKRVDVKVSSNSLALTLSGHDVVVYKMHGDVSSPDQVILTKDDYETYNHGRQLFTTALQHDLASRTFLFIGFSFTDPNLSFVLSQMKALLGTHVRTHYCLMRQVLHSEFQTDDQYAYAKRKQQLKVRDLARYGIHTVLVESYEEITRILRHLQLLMRRTFVFVSGSACQYGEWSEAQARDLTERLGQALVANKSTVCTGYGLGVGESLIRGVLQADRTPTRSATQYLRLGHMPSPAADNADWRQYRVDMLRDAGIAIFLFGNKMDASGSQVTSDGMLEEFQIAVDHAVVPIPIGATGFVAESLWNKVMHGYDRYVGVPNLRSYYERLGDRALSNTELVDTVIKIVRGLSTC